MLGPSGEIEYATPLGGKACDAGAVNNAQQGPITFTETVAGRVMRFMKEVARKRRHTSKRRCTKARPKLLARLQAVDCFFVPDRLDRDWENRTQLTLINGTVFFHFFGDRIPGNAA